ncbi:iron chelate uptake ABC transporter family permease subunit [Xanthobacter autotrophicus]|uniref:iron chelate uptake ABC transporter family permease subunit n=1 Tax=Xanthobacter autotrophicus TaxID=280 RepID=UPI0037266D24
MTAALYAPALLEGGRDGVALAGSAATVGLVAALALRRALSPVTVILAGLVVALLCGALGGMMDILARDHLQAVTLWGAGVLEQNGWDAAHGLTIRFALMAVGAILLIRPATLLALDEETARGLGLGLLASRTLVLGVATALSACVVRAVGVIGFIGLAAPALARQLGAHRLHDRIWLAPVLGAALLLGAGQCIQMLPSPLDGMPTGTAAALIGAPVLLWMIAAHPKGHALGSVRARHPLQRLCVMAVLTSDVETLSVFTFNVSGYAIALAVTLGSFAYLALLSPVVCLLAVVAAGFGAADRIADRKGRTISLYWAAEAADATAFFAMIGILLCARCWLGIDALALLHVREPISLIASALPMLDQARISLDRISRLSHDFDHGEAAMPLADSPRESPRRCISRPSR